MYSLHGASKRPPAQVNLEGDANLVVKAICYIQSSRATDGVFVQEVFRLLVVCPFFKLLSFHRSTNMVTYFVARMTLRYLTRMLLVVLTP
ncbi:hypothetical protein LINPERPRIM_LOCUS11882 [Linum perenne]